ncbi:MAG TPA: hypothetical protein DIC50_02025 [Verrucomicrobia subdivision 3 bacterium]|jgi:hypothetical protein|nr:hypothetical protein [Limisphaerales bacterium]
MWACFERCPSNENANFDSDSGEAADSYCGLFVYIQRSSERFDFTKAVCLWQGAWQFWPDLLASPQQTVLALFFRRTARCEIGERRTRAPQ